MKNKLFAEIMFHKITGMKAKATLVGNGYNYIIKYKGKDIGTVREYSNDLFPGGTVFVSLVGRKSMSISSATNIRLSANRILGKFGISV